MNILFEHTQLLNNTLEIARILMMAEDTSQQAADGQQEHFFVTKASQQNKAPAHRKFSYTGTRDLTDVQKIQELDIVAEDGTIRGMRNRVRAGQAHFDNPVARAKVSCQSKYMQSTIKDFCIG